MNTTTTTATRTMTAEYLVLTIPTEAMGYPVTASDIARMNDLLEDAIVEAGLEDCYEVIISDSDRSALYIARNYDDALAAAVDAAFEMFFNTAA